MVAKSDLKKSEIFELLDFTCYFDLQKIPVPSNQDGILHYILEDSIRKTVTKYPMIALRKIIANALIHQDFTVTG